MIFRVLISPVDVPLLPKRRMAATNPFLLAASTPEPDSRLLPLLRSNPSLASAQDAHGYSLLHAAASYKHTGLLRTLVSEFKVDVNLLDEDHETCLFVAESVETARCLVEELHIDTGIKNDDDLTAVDKIESEADYPEVAAYLRGQSSGAITNGSHIADARSASHPPPLPPNVTIDVNTTPQQEDVGEPDPEFRRRIEELAAKENFNTEEGQQELRALITDAVRGTSAGERAVRQRTG